MVSRFKTQKHINNIKLKIQSNQNDILIGTHALLNNNIYLNNLGLLVVDEEHRFGVKHKESIKEIKTNINENMSDIGTCKQGGACPGRNERCSRCWCMPLMIINGYQ